LAIIPVIDETRCDGCGLCIEVCKCGALVMAGNKVTIVKLKVDDCGWCMDCELVCDTGALQCPLEIVSAEDK